MKILASGVAAEHWPATFTQQPLAPSQKTELMHTCALTPSHNSHLSTLAIFLCPQWGHCGEVSLSLWVFLCLFVHTCMWASAVCQCVCLSVKLSLYLCVCLSILDNQCAIPSLYSCEVFIHSVSSLCSKLFGHYVTFVFFLGP